MTTIQMTNTPKAAGFHMPAEWEPHAGCLMAWPSRPDLWGDTLPAAKRDYATVANAIARFEPVVMVCNPGLSAEVRSACSDAVQPVEIPINDSWARDSGPTFVRNAAGELAIVGFGFNAWGNRWHPHDDDARLAERLANWFGLPFFKAPLVLEGGSFFVDGEGTVITTEQCLLNPNRNPEMSRQQIESALMEYLGVSTVIWLPYGHSLDTGPAGTDGHVDGVLQYTSAGCVLLEAVADTSSPEYERGVANLERLHNSRDAAGRSFNVAVLDPGSLASVSYANYYLANGAVIVPIAGEQADGPALEVLRAQHPDRVIVGVPGETLAFGGGGPHCITQQIPLGVKIPEGLSMSNDSQQP
jgi:agmatine deiminase